jgi:NAD(P)-dependent dehydrogenase (short-subunit alcohol dehydrogenase family)
VNSKDSFSLAGKTIFVTGASSGLGRGIACACSASGAKVILLGRDKKKLEDSAQDCGGALDICICNLSVELDNLPRLVRDLVKRHGPIDGLVHSAGLLKMTPLRVLRSKVALELFQVNALAGVMLTKGLAETKQTDSRISVVFLSSVMGQVGQPGRSAYCLSKGAVEGAVKALALELIPENIRVNAVAPSIIETTMLEEYFESVPDSTKEKTLAELPMGLGKAEDVASATVFLLSEASRFITGVSLLVDGGYCAK